MVRAELDAIPTERHSRSLELRSGQRTYTVKLEQALALAHSLLKAKRYKTAMRICEKVASVDSYNPQTAILLACCEAGMKDYSACQKTLQSVFSGDDGAMAEHLQAAFVYHHLSMNRDATQELIALTDEGPDLPMGWLLLGDLLSDTSNREKAARCWRLAIDQDKLYEGAATAARKELADAKLAIRL